MSDSELGWLANLSGSAAKLLLYALLSGGLAGKRNADVMRVTGVTHKGTFFRARNEILEQELYSLWVRSGAENAPNRTSIGAETEPNRTSQVQTGAENAPAQVQLGAETEPIARDDEDGAETEPPSWLDQAEVIDSWPRDGGADPHSKTNWQKRRNAQVKLVCMAWPSYFPDTTPLTTQMAKQYLSLGGDSAVEVINLFLYAAEVRNVHGDGSKGYILTALRNRKNDVARKPVVTPTRNDDGLDDADPALIEQMRGLQAMRDQLGWSGEDD
jgi:hypothetical protein